MEDDDNVSVSLDPLIDFAVVAAAAGLLASYKICAPLAS
jgi:hypothetical protein